MPPRVGRVKTGFFVLEAMNSFGTVYYAYYLFFFMNKEFGFGNKANLALAALYGGIYTISSWLGGRVAPSLGYFNALKLGFGTMAAALLVGSHVGSASGQIVVMAATVMGMCLTWPTLEALISEGEPLRNLPRMVGIYNVVWSGTGALAYFTGGAMLEKLGERSMFYVPATLFIIQVVITFWLQARVRAGEAAPGSVAEASPKPESFDEPLNPRPIARAKMFQRMAWLANPFAYIAINTLIAVMPGLADKMKLSTMTAGFCCSVWCFARVAAFLWLWKWEGWHYRFRWLLAAYVGLLVTFTTILLAPNLAVLVVTQIVLGGALGLIYYSSLFYSMDASETKSAHGGIHEAAIGLGNFLGPGLGAASLHFFPQSPNSGSIAVSALLAAGLAGLVAIRKL